MSTQQVSWTDSFSQAQSAIQSLTTILPAVPQTVTASENPAFALLNDPELAEHISNHIRQPDSGAGDNQLCRWLYDTFHTSKIDLQLVVLRFLPIIAGVYLSRVPLRKPLAGFEAVLLAIYAHETTSRNGQAVTINISDASHPSVYHENKNPYKTASPELHLVVVSPALEPQGTIRSTKRARIIGVALELYHSKIADMPVQSKLDFCEFCIIWAGQDDDDDNNDEKEDDQKGETKNEKKEGRILLPWEMSSSCLGTLTLKVEVITLFLQQSQSARYVRIGIKGAYTTFRILIAAMSAQEEPMVKMNINTIRKRLEMEGLDDKLYLVESTTIAETSRLQ
nr:hypothetical protein [Tanacetum cinerariifolium]